MDIKKMYLGNSQLAITPATSRENRAGQGQSSSGVFPIFADCAWDVGVQESTLRAGIFNCAVLLRRTLSGESFAGLAPRRTALSTGV